MIKLVTLNVERDEHADKVLPFLVSEDADVVCLQEVMEQDAKTIAEALKYHYYFIPVTIFTEKGGAQQQGIGLFSKFPLQEAWHAYYYLPEGGLQTFDRTNYETKRATIAHGIVWAEVEKEGKIYCVATTHFTWTPNGQSDQYQHHDLPKLFEITDGIGELVLCGDFNAPRGYNDIYGLLANKFKDNIPTSFQTTLDVNLHRVRNKPEELERISKFVVDYIFTTPKYAVANVRQQFGVSDHTAIIADIE